MKYSLEFKMNCVKQYRNGSFPPTPEGIKTETFRRKVRMWVRIEEIHGEKGLAPKTAYSSYSADEKFELVAAVLAGHSMYSLAIQEGIEPSMLNRWVNQYKIYGYEALEPKRKGRRPKVPHMTEKNMPAELNESEREEIIKLRERVKYLEAENAAIKKKMLLREEKFEEQRREKRQKSSGTSGKKDTH